MVSRCIKCNFEMISLHVCFGAAKWEWCSTCGTIRHKEADSDNYVVLIPAAIKDIDQIKISIDCEQVND